MTSVRCIQLIVMQWCCIFSLFVALANSQTTLPDASILLRNMEPAELDNLLDSRLENLQLDILRLYQDQLKHHERTVDTLERHKRQSLNDPIALLPDDDHHFGHSYVFETGVGNREVVAIDSLDLVDYLGSLTVTDVFPLHLTNLIAIYKGLDGFGYVVVDGILKVLTVRNEWTASTSGCRCDGSSPPISLSHASCACCLPGACLCKFSLGFTGDACVPCGSEALKCHKAGTKELELDAAVGFEYSVHDSGLQQIVITAKSTVISFYKVDSFGLQIVRSATGLSIITSPHPVTHLGYGETHVNHYGILKRKRFLVSFCAGQTKHQLHELMVGYSNVDIAVGLSRDWEATGTSMKVTHTNGRLVITVLEDNHLNVYEFKEDRFQQFHFEVFQRLSLRTYILRWSTFTAGFENYLVVVSETTVTIYLLRGRYYHKLSTIYVDGDLTQFDNAVAINLESCSYELVLIVGSGSRAAVYVFDKSVEPFVPRRVKLYNLEVENALWKLAFGYSDEGGARLILPGPTIPVIYALRAHLEEIEDIIWKENTIVEETILRFKDEYRRQLKVTNVARDRLEHSVAAVSGSDLTFNNDITISQSLIVSQTLITNILVANQISQNGTGIDGVDYLRRFEETKNRLSNVVGQLEDIQTTLDGAISIGGGTRPVGGTITIVNPGLNLQTLIANNINLGQPRDLNGNLIDLEKLLRGLIRSGIDGGKITGQKIFEGILIVGELNAVFLDDIPVSDLVTVGDDQTIAGAIYNSIFFAQEIVLRPGATIGGVDISRAIQLTNNARLGSVIFQSIAVEGDLQISSNLVNGVDLQRLFQSALLLTGGEVSGSLAFTQELLISSLDARELMGIDVQNFLNNVVFKDQPAFIEGRLTVGGRVILQNLQVDGKINNRNFLEDYPLRSGNGPIVFRGQKSFINVKFGNVKFGPQGNVDRIDPDTLVTKSTNQFISGNKVFGQGVHIRGNLEINSKTIDGVNLDEISGNGQFPGTDPGTLDVIFNGHVTLPRLAYTGLLNGLDFSNFASDILSNDGPLRVNGLKRFLSGLTVGNAQINGLLNGDGINTLITTSRDHFVSGLKTFINNVSFTNLFAALVDGVDLDEFFNSVVYLDQDGQVITGKKLFTNSAVISSLNLQGKLSNVDFSNVVTKSGNQIFTAAQTLTAVTFSDVEVQRITLLDGFTVNGIDLSELAARRVTLKSPVDHTGSLIIDGPLSVVGNLMAESINGINIKELEENIVMGKGNCTISGPVEISNLVVSSSVNTLNGRGANGLSLRDISNRAAKLNGNNRFIGDIHFAELELRGDINVNRLVNGVHLATLRDDAVYIRTNTLQKITGTKMFLNGFHVKGDINTASTNGVDLSKRLFTLNTDQHISAYYAFENILARGNVFLIGKFNDIDLRSLTSSITINQSRLDEIRFNGNVKVRELIIEGSLDGRNIQALLLDAIRLSISGISITGKKSFTSTVQFRSLNVDRLNGVHLVDFLANVILRNRNKVVSRLFTVNGLVSAPSVTAENIAVQGTLDGVNYRTLKNNVIYLDRPQDVQTELIFERSIVVKRNILAAFLNGRSLAGDYLTTRTEQFISVGAHLARVSSTHVEVGGLVNGIYLPNLQNLTMQIVGGQVITGITTIKGITKVLRNVVVTGRTGTGVKLDLGSEVIDLFTGGEINGLLRFPVMLSTSSLTSSVTLINGIDCLKLFNNALFVDLPATITARFFFSSLVTFRAGLVVNGRVDGLDINTLYDTTAAILAQFGTSTTEIKVQYGSMCNSIVSLYDQLEDSLYEGDCFQYAYTELFPEQRHSSYSLRIFGNTYLILSYEHQCYSEVYVWNNLSRTFTFYQSLATTGYAHHFVHVETGDGRVYIAIAASSTKNFCTDKNATIWEVTPNSIQVVKILVPGETVSKEIISGKSRINVHSLSNTVIYEYDFAGAIWREVDAIEKYDIAVHVVDSQGFTISFRSNGGIGEVWAGGVSRETTQLGYAIYDAVLFVHHHKVILFVVVTVYNPQGYRYELRAYEIEYGTLVWLHTVQLRTIGKLSVFDVGNYVCRAAYIAVTQKDYFPVVYTFFSERLTLWREIVMPRTTWIQYFSLPNSRLRELLDHYLIFGRNDKSALVYSLQMRGLTVPEIELSCKIEAFRNPLLKPIVLI